jgi:hypothetical protein
VAFESFPREGDDVHKKTCALAGLAAAAAGAVLVTGSPAYAGALVQGHRHHHSSYNRNANYNRNHNRVVVRVINHNVNSAFAAGRERDDDDGDFGLFHRRCHFGCHRFDRFDRFDDDRGFGRDDDRGDNIIVGNDIRTARD